MNRRNVLKISSFGFGTASLGLLANVNAQPAAITPTIGAELSVVEIAAGLGNPWSVAILPDGRYLVTERAGRLSLIDTAGKRTTVEGVPTVRAEGQGGLLDVVLSPQFERDATIFLSYAEPVGSRESRTAVAVARLKDNRLSDVNVIFRQAPTAPDGYHFGSRLVFDREGYLFVTTGDRYALKDQAQNTANHIGKVLRITTDGKPAPGNPTLQATEANTKALPEIWTYGHRNMQGAALHPITGQLWTNEHGARGGDEINICLPGKNFGWPIITLGIDYSGAKIGEGKAKPGLEQPIHFWVPSIAVSGMAFDRKLTQGSRTAVWVGGLAGQVLARVTFNNNVVASEERFLQNLKHRIRDVRQMPDGRLLVLTDSRDGKLLTVSPPA